MIALSNFFSKKKAFWTNIFLHNKIEKWPYLHIKKNTWYCNFFFEHVVTSIFLSKNLFATLNHTLNYFQASFQKIYKSKKSQCRKKIFAQKNWCCLYIYHVIINLVISMYIKVHMYINKCKFFYGYCYWISKKQKLKNMFLSNVKLIENFAKKQIWFAEKIFLTNFVF